MTTDGVAADVPEGVALAPEMGTLVARGVVCVLGVSITLLSSTTLFLRNQSITFLAALLLAAVEEDRVVITEAAEGEGLAANLSCALEVVRFGVSGRLMSLARVSLRRRAVSLRSGFVDFSESAVLSGALPTTRLIAFLRAVLVLRPRLLAMEVSALAPFAVLTEPLPLSFTLLSLIC